MPIIPIIPSINTCMTLTTCSTATTTTTAPTTLPQVNTTQLQAFADVCSTVNSIEPMPVLNSLVSATKVVSTNLLPNQHVIASVNNISLPEKIPISSLPVPLLKMKDDEDMKPVDEQENNKEKEEENKIDENGKEVVEDTPIENNEADIPIEPLIASEEEKPTDDEDVPIAEPDAPIQTDPLIEEKKSDSEEMQEIEPLTEPMDCIISPKHTPKSDDILMSDTASSPSGSMQVESSDVSIVSSDHLKFDKEITVDDLLLLCDLFYLPFEHGSKALRLLNEFHWLKSNASTIVGHKKGGTNDAETTTTEVQEWVRRADAFGNMCEAIQVLMKKIALCENREICYDLYTYIWEINGVTSLLNAFVKWLALGHFHSNINSFTQGSYTCKYAGIFL